MMTDAPTAIRARQADRVLELDWSDGRHDRLGYRSVRIACPCASCRDEWTGERILKPESVPADLGLEGLEAVGNYAIRITWSDGHGSGLFPWDALRRLGDPGRA